MSDCCHKARPWYKEPLMIVSVIVFGFWLAQLAGVRFLDPVFGKFREYLSLSWWAIGLGLLIGGLIDILVPEEAMARLLGRGKKSILVAVGLGFLASACSHGILAIAVSLYKKGASTASTLAFLLAAPWANLAITLLLFSLFGLRALLIVGGALSVAILAGLVFQILEEKGMIEPGQKVNLEGKIKWHWPGWVNLGKRLFESVWSLTKMVLWWVLVGFLLASILGSFIPEAWMQRYFGASLWGLAATLVLASVIEICSEGSAPLAFELFKKTGAFGNAFVFLQAGVATDLTEIGLISTTIGKKAALALVLVTVPMILLLGFFLNNFVR